MLINVATPTLPTPAHLVGRRRCSGVGQAFRLERRRPDRRGRAGRSPIPGPFPAAGRRAGVEKETGFTLITTSTTGTSTATTSSWPTAPTTTWISAEGKKSIYALEGTEILIQRDKEVQLAAHDYGQGRGVYISGLPYSFANSRALYRAHPVGGPQRGRVAYLVQLQLQRRSARLREKRQVLRGEQYLRAPGYPPSTPPAAPASRCIWRPTRSAVQDRLSGAPPASTAFVPKGCEPCGRCKIPAQTGKPP